MEAVRDYELKAFLNRAIEVLESLEIPYMVVGGFAAILYGEPRLTLDVDIVVDMKPEHIEPLVASFPFTRSAFQRRQRLEYDESGHSAVFITSEDIILAKLIAYRETSSDKHLRDARGVLVTQWGDLDLEAIRLRAQESGVFEQFEELLELARREMAG